MLIRIRTKNDINGNSRRAWALIEPESSRPLAWYDEGHRGYEALPVHLRSHVASAMDIIVAPAEFKRLRKIYDVEA